MFLLTLAVRNGQPLFRKETPVMILVGSAGAWFAQLSPPPGNPS